MLCERCFQPEAEGAHGVGLCPYERRPAHAVRPDDIPGGLVIEHGLCHDDGTPRTYYSRSEIRQACVARGLTPWTDVYTEDKTKDARVRADWLQSGEAQRQKADRDERRRAGVPMPRDRPVRAPRPGSPERRALIQRLARARLDAS